VVVAVVAAVVVVTEVLEGKEKSMTEVHQSTPLPVPTPLLLRTMTRSLEAQEVEGGGMAAGVVVTILAHQSPVGIEEEVKVVEGKEVTVITHETIDPTLLPRTANPSEEEMVEEEGAVEDEEGGEEEEEEIATDPKGRPLPSISWMLRGQDCKPR
jgi:hypothetical protein